MPIYEYQCRKCGKVTEALQRMSDRPLRKCPHCTGRLEKIVSRSAFVLKGGGWYAEGYNKSGKKSKRTGGSSSGSSSTGGSKKSDNAKNRTAAAASA